MWGGSYSYYGCYGDLWGCYGCQGCSGAGAVVIATPVHNCGCVGIHVAPIEAHGVVSSGVYAEETPVVVQPAQPSAEAAREMKLNDPLAAPKKDMPKVEAPVIQPKPAQPKPAAPIVPDLDKLFKDVPKVEPKPGAAPKIPDPAAPGQESARVTVRLPAEAKLTVDNVTCPLTSEVRSFNTPGLNRGQVYFYTMVVELTQNGQTVRDSQRVLVRAGESVEVNFNHVGVATSTAAAR